MRKLIQIVAIYVSFLLAGCSTFPPLETAVNALNNSKVCCESFAGINYEKLPEGKVVQFGIDEDTSSFQFESGKSFFKAFELPSSNEALVLDVKSFYNGDVFYPVITVLKEDYSVSRVIGKETITRKEPTNFTDGHIGGFIEIDPSSNEKYVIIHTDLNILGLKEESDNPGFAGLYGGSYVYIPPSTYTHNYSAFGRLKVKVSKVSGG